MKNQEQNIKKELKELGVSLEHNTSMHLSVPTGYFESFKKDTLELISAIDFVENLPKEMPQQVPTNYFEGLKEEVLDEVAVLDFEQNMPKRMPQYVPQGYFDQAKQQILAEITKETEAQPAPLSVTRSTSRKNWALAASMALILSIGLFFIKSDSSLNLENELANVPTEMIDSYIQNHEYDFEAYDILENPQLTTQAMQSLEEEILHEIENLSNEEIFEFVL